LCFVNSAERRGWGWGGPRGDWLGDRGGRCGHFINGCPLIGRLASCGCRHFLSLGMPFLPLPVLVFLVFFEFASSSVYSSRRALLPDTVEPSGSPPSESSQSSRSGGSSVFWACCAMVVVHFLFPSACLPFWAALSFFSVSFAAAAAAFA